MRDWYQIVAVIILGQTNYSVMAQSQTPLFEMLLYFEDAVGNRDTLSVGYDPGTCCRDTLDGTFGEISIDQPFDSVLDVRAQHDDMIHTSSIVSKRIVGRYSMPEYGCIASEGIPIFISAQNFPISISYDTAILNNSMCNNNTVFSPSWELFIRQYWWNTEIFSCLANTNSVIIEEEFLDNCNACLTKEFEVDGYGLKVLPGYFLLFQRDFYCQTLVADENAPSSRDEISVSPIPTDDYLTIQNTGCDGCVVQVFSLNGAYQEVLELIGSDLNVSNLKPGMYVGFLLDTDQVKSFKFIVSR